jgi:UTP--glucose-1-phosphate uridylyltransferase
MVALIPAAGLGTRMADFALERPKELLPLGETPVLGRVFAEAIEAGAEEIVVVSSEDKPEVDEYVEDFDAVAGAIFGDEVRYRIVHQAAPLGVLDAIARAGEERDTLVLLGDVVLHGGSPLDRMANLLHMGIDACVAVREAKPEDAGTYGLVQVHPVTGAVTRSVEASAGAQDLWASVGRYAFGPRAMAFLLDFHARWMAEPPAEGEASLATLLQRALEAGIEVKAVALQPGQEALDCGSPEGYRRATGLF